MKINRNLFSSILFAVASAMTMSAYAAHTAEHNEAAQQSTEDMSAKGRYKIAQKEANAAYQQAVADCKKMKKSEQSACMKEAKSNHESDLAQAKKALNSSK